MSYIREIITKLNIINKNLIEKVQIFHNDLKSDNILIKLKTDKDDTSKCGTKRSPVDLYMIDFGNSIYNVQNKELLSYKEFMVKKYYQVYKSPDMTCFSPQDGYIKLSKVLAWYLGCIAFELCSGGAEHKLLAPQPHLCGAIRQPTTHEQANANAYNAYIAQYRGEIYQSSNDMCFQPAMANFLQNALRFNERSRPTSDNLVSKLTAKAYLKKETV